MRFSAFLSVLLLTALYVNGQEDIAITGTIKDTEGNLIKNALIRFENLDYVTVSSEDGKFLLTNSSPVQRLQPAISSRSMYVSQNVLFFSCEQHEPLTFSVYNLQGKQCHTRRITDLAEGAYRIGLHGVVPAHIAGGTYVVAATLHGKRVAGKVIHRAHRQQTLTVTAVEDADNSFHFAKQLSSMDVVTVSKLGYVSESIPIDSYQDDLGEIILENSDVLDDEEALDALEDSLVQVFIDRIESIEELDGPDELNTIDFISIRNGFEAILDVDSTRITSNIGYMLTAIASLNANPRIWELVDSLDAYFSSFEDDEMVVEGGASESEFFAKTMRNGGVLALGKAMAVKTPEVLQAATENPSFPKFITISYLQNMIERDCIPVLANIQLAAGRVEKYSEGSMTLTVDEETVEIDKGEVFLFDASVHLVQAYLLMLCTYDMDLFTSASQKDYSWIDSMAAIDHDGEQLFTLSGDTLFEINNWQGDKESMITMAGVFQYNLEERESFMTIRRPYHTLAHNCLLAVPEKIRGGLDAINAETDDQDDDIIKIAYIDSANQEMVGLSEQMVEEGVSEELAAHFSSVDNLLDFVTDLLSGPVTFDEVIDEKQVSVTVDLSSFFTSPVEDMRELLPYYTWTNREDWAEMESDMWLDTYYHREFVYSTEGEIVDTVYTFYVYDDNATVAIDESVIDSVVDQYGTKKYYINQPINFHAYVDSSFYFNALRLADPDGNVLDEETMEEMMDNGTFFPYFADYTFNGLFPEMTRDKWLDLVWSE